VDTETEPAATDAASAPKAALNLDILERENPKAPFDFVHHGRRYLLSDPQEIDWQRLLVAMRNPVLFVRLVLPPDDHREFFGTDLPAWKMNALMKAYQEHYGLPAAGEADGLPR
jgi:hypothetical protein